MLSQLSKEKKKEKKKKKISTNNFVSAKKKKKIVPHVWFQITITEGLYMCHTSWEENRTPFT